MEDNIHPLVKLLKARADVAPEEFNRGAGSSSRWGRVVAVALPWLTETEKLELRGIYLDMAHNMALEELLNGPINRMEKQQETKLPLLGQQIIQQWELRNVGSSYNKE